jgi:hypothetical protein
MEDMGSGMSIDLLSMWAYGLPPWLANPVSNSPARSIM